MCPFCLVLPICSILRKIRWVWGGKGLLLQSMHAEHSPAGYQIFLLYLTS